MTAARYRPEIDGLRAMAVIPVVVFHMGAAWLPGGFVGVDVFFVISGYLITQVILHSQREGNFTFREFWLRRIRRILPTLIAVVISSLAAGSALSYAPDLATLGSQGCAALVSLANVNLWLTTGDYWGPAAESSVFLHTWSLSLEEQFYLFFPVLMALGARSFPRRLAVVLAALCLASFSLFLLGTRTHPAATFYLLPTRAWELGVGAVLAVVTPATGLRASRSGLLAGLGLGAIVSSCFLIDGKSGVSASLLAPVAGAVVILAFAGDRASLTHRALASPPLRGIGRISYSIYMWHWPIIVLGRVAEMKFAVNIAPALTLAAILTISTGSYFLVEQSFRHQANRTWLIGVAFVCAFAASLTRVAIDPTEDTSMFSETRWRGNAFNVAPGPGWPAAVRRRMRGISVEDGPPTRVDLYTTGIKKPYGKPTPEVVVIGDSHALMWSGLLDDIARELGVSVAFFGADGTPAFFEIPVHRQGRTQAFTADEKYRFDLARLELLHQWRPPVLVLSARWSNYSDAALLQDMLGLAAEVGARVLLLEQPPELFFGDQNTPQYLSYTEITPTTNKQRQYIPTGNSEKHTRGQRLLRDVASQCRHCTLVPVADIYLNEERGDRAWVLDGRDVLYIDDDHLSEAGSRKARDRILGALRDSLAPPKTTP